MHDLIEHNKSRIIKLCKRHHVKELYVFGSVVRDDFTPESDIDFWVVFDDWIIEPAMRVTNEDALKESLKNLLRREIDLVQYRRIQNKYLRYFINQDKQLSYAEM